MRMLPALASLVLAGVLGAGCGDDPTTSAVDGPSTIQPAAGATPDGTRRVSCKVKSDHGTVRFALDLPTEFVGAGSCRWRMPLRAPANSSGVDGDAVVAVASVGSDDTLTKIHDSQEPDAVEGDDPEGDDSILRLDFRQDTPVFGDTVGDRLTYDCYCDGQELLSRYAQADGVRVSWDSYWFVTEETNAQFDAALAGAGTVG